MISSIGPVYQPQWPSSFAKFLAFLDAIFNLNAFGLFPLDCIGHTDFYLKMDVYVLGYGCVIVCALWYLALLARKSGHRAEAMREIVMRALLMFTNFFYMAVATLTFQAMPCEEFEDDQKLLH